MASLRRLLKHRNPWRAVSSLQTLTPASRDLPHRPFRNITNVAKGENWKSGSEFGSLYSMMPVLLAGGLFGVGMVERAYADGNEGASQNPALPGSPSPDAVDMEKIAREERSRLRVLLNGKGMQHGSYPPFLVATKGRKVSIKFPIPQTCDTSHLIANIIANLGLKAEESGAGSSMILHAWDSAIAWQLKLNRPEKLKGTRGSLAEDQDGDEGDFCVLIFHSLLDSKAEIEFIKEGRFSLKELEALASSLKVAAESVSASRPSDKRIRGFPERREIKPDVQAPSAEKSVAALEAMGVRVFGLDTDAVSSKNEISWDIIAGYDQQKREIEDTILLALHSPEVYDDIARGTRRKFESNRPRAVLFEGPPGTGKTSCARVIANQAGVPLLYVPLEVVMSKYYGESERLLGSVFSLANELPNGAIIFLDEVDSFAAARDDGMHEATRRVLSVLLRQIDGFEQDKRVVVIAATNRKEDLDPALISRFDSMITFGLPDRQNRQEIVAQYAKHLTTTELMELAAVTEQDCRHAEIKTFFDIVKGASHPFASMMSGRDIRDVCQQAERHWASKIIRGQASGEDEQDRLPPIQEYIECAVSRQKSLLNIPDKKSRDQRISVQKKPMDFI